MLRAVVSLVALSIASSGALRAQDLTAAPSPWRRIAGAEGRAQ